MTAHILDGRKIAADLKTLLKAEIARLKEKYNIVPGLAVIRVGDNPASKIYVASKIKQCQEVGIQSFQALFDTHVAQDDILKQMKYFNENPDIHGILVQLPLPFHLESDTIIQSINPKKDVDGLHPQNLGFLMIGNPFIVPCTPRGCLNLIKSFQTDLKGLNALIIGRSRLVGKPLALTLLKENCTVTIAHSHTKNLSNLCREADILVAALGQPHFIQGDWIKPGAIVLDIGIHHQENDGISYLKGDVNFDAAKEIAGALSPVPGGVGPMTVVSLLQNTVELMTLQLREEEQSCRL